MRAIANVPADVYAWELLSEYDGKEPLICSVLSNEKPVPFWRPEWTGWTIEAIQVESFDSGQISLWDIPSQKYILRTSENTLIQLHRNGFLVQLECPAELNFTPILYLDLKFPIDHNLGKKSRLVHEFHRMISTTAAFRVNIHRKRKLEEYLIALDADLSGLSYRETAIKLWGETIVSKSWNGGQGYLKNRVRRYVARGHYYMNGGYLDLLKK